MVAKLNDPLLHLVRNSIDHGIETPRERQLKGKPEKGSIDISAIHSGSHILITIHDDGKGLDPQLIKNKAIQNGLIQSDTHISNKELFNLIFEPGFSTASQVTDVSGRGVGMDVARKNIESLGGFIAVDSEPGLGCTFTLKLPLTLAIIEGLLVSVGQECYVIPLTTVKKCVELTPEMITQSHGESLVNFNNQMVPYVSLRQHFNLQDANVPIEHKKLIF